MPTNFSTHANIIDLKAMHAENQRKLVGIILAIPDQLKSLLHRHHRLLHNLHYYPVLDLQTYEHLEAFEGWKLNLP